MNDRIVMFSRSTLLLSAMMAPMFAHAGSVAIWPIDPVIEHGEQATAIWIENRGDTKAVLQLRIFEWSQQEGEEVLAPQNKVIGSPPIMEIPAGQKQYVRIIRQGQQVADSEHSYRVVVDELPVADEGQPANTAGISMKMRYSFPLFTYGEGLHGLDAPGSEDHRAHENLDYRVIADLSGQFLEVTNTGKYHAQLKGVSFIHDAGLSEIAPGLLGYVLAGSSRRWPLPEAARVSDQVAATVNNQVAQDKVQVLNRTLAEK